jgi:acetyltransferase-like isoleucine patch superfamily enzyme
VLKKAILLINTLFYKLKYKITLGEKSFIGGKVIIRNSVILNIKKNSYINNLEIKGVGTITIGSNCNIEDLFINFNHKDSNSNIKIGNNVYIGKGTKFIIFGKLSIMDNTLIAPDVSIIDNDHIIAKNKKTIDLGVNIKDIEIGTNVWIGTKSTILKSSKIKDGSVIGAMSLVNSCLDKSAIYAGIPVKKIKDIN